MANEKTITRYEWPDGQTIRRIDVRHQTDGRAVAYIDADDAETARARRTDIRAAIRMKGWGTLSDHRNGQFVLRVTGLRTGYELIDMLTRDGFITGTPRVTETAIEDEKSKNVGEFIRTNSLRTSGILYTIGNAMYTLSGFARGKDIGQIGTGLAFGAGDALLASVGGKDDARQFTSLIKQLKNHFENVGIEIPHTASIHVEASDKDKSFGERLYDWLHRHVNQIKCWAEVVGGYFYFKAGHLQKNIWKQATAVTFSAGFATSALVPEKKKDEEAYAKATNGERLLMDIQSNPLSVGGISGLSNTLFTTIGAFQERAKEMEKPLSRRTHHYRWDFAIPGVMLFANILYAMSKKTTGGDIKTDAMIRDVYSVAAQILNKQPEGPIREQAIQSTARFLGERPEIKDRHAEIVVRLKEEMTIQRQNPWFEKKPLAPYVPQPKKGKPTVARAANENFDIANENVPSTVIEGKDLQHEVAAAAALERG